MDKMYKYVGDLAGLDENTILLDICSGIGTIGLSVGKNAKKIIGIEMVESSCDNARKNAASCETGSKY
jgi:tRNA/tmRNA/rRNA uracil-C5-methylase (TrmA/RlmC/RlmD family)